MANTLEDLKKYKQSKSGSSVNTLETLRAFKNGTLRKPEPDKPKAKAKIAGKTETVKASDAGVTANARIPTEQDIAIRDMVQNREKINTLSLGDPQKLIRQQQTVVDPVGIRTGLAKERETEQKKAIAEGLKGYGTTNTAYNIPIIGGIAKAIDQREIKKAVEILSPDEMRIYEEGLRAEPFVQTTIGDRRIYGFKGNVSPETQRQFSDIANKVSTASTPTLTKLLERIGRQGVATAFGDPTRKEQGKESGLTDTGSTALNIIGDIGGTIMGYNVPTGAVGGATAMTGANALGESAIQKLTQRCLHLRSIL